LEGAMAARFNPTKGRVMPPDGKNLLRRRQVKAVREGTMRPYLRTRSNGAQFAHHPADAFLRDACPVQPACERRHAVLRLEGAARVSCRGGAERSVPLGGAEAGRVAGSSGGGGEAG